MENGVQMRLGRLLLRAAATCAAMAFPLWTSQPAGGAHPIVRQTAITAAAIRGYEPHYIVDARNQVSGFAVDVMDAVAKRANVKVTYQIFDSPEEAIAALVAGQVDLIPSIGVSSSRWRIGILSAPYETLRVSLIVRSGQRKVGSLDDLKGLLVGVVRLTTAAEVLADRDIRTRPFPTLPEAFRALLDGEIEVLADPGVSVRRLAHIWGMTDAIEVTGPPVEDAERGMVFGTGRASLFDQLAPLLREFTGSTQFDELHRRWFALESRHNHLPWPWIGGSLIGLCAFVVFLIFYRRALAAGIVGDPEQVRLEKELWKRRMATAAVFMAATMVVALITLSFLYQTAFEEARADLVERADSEASLIEAVARADRLSSGDPAVARLRTLMQVTEGLGGGGGEGEIVLAERSGDDVVFVLRQRASRPLAPISIPSGSELAEAVQLALAGHKGTLVGLDYRGQKALAAYRPVAGLGLGYAVNKELKDIQAPFIRAAFIVVAASSGLALLGTLAYLRITLPLVRRLLFSETQSRSLFLAMSDGVTTYRAVDGGSDFAISDVNPAGEQLERRPRDQLVGRRITELRHRNEAAELIEVMRDVWKSGSARQILPRQYLLDAKPAWRAHKVYRLPSGEVVTVFDDVTEREEALSALRQSEERFRQIAESIREVFWLAEPAMNRLLYVNPAFEEVWGIPADLIYADLSRLIETVHPEDRRRVAQAFHDQGPEPFDMEYRIVRPDGTLRWIRDRGFPVLNAQGQVHRVVGTAEDVTEQKDRESQLFQTQKLDAVGQLTGGVAHDFNNLLQAVLCNVELLRLRVAGDEAAVELIRAIEDASLSGAHLVDNMLAFARRKPLVVEEVDVNASIGGMQPLIATLGDEIEVDLRLEAECALVLTDEDYLKAAVLNLLVNARDAMPKGGAIVVQTRVAEVSGPRADRLMGLASGSYIVIEVEDGGCGIAREDLPRIFEPFYTTKEPGAGTGLGLPMVYGFAKQCGGSAQVSSEPGTGTTVRLYLPRCTAVKARSKHPSRVA